MFGLSFGVKRFQFLHSQIRDYDSPIYCFCKRERWRSARLLILFCTVAASNVNENNSISAPLLWENVMVVSLIFVNKIFDYPKPTTIL